MEGRIAAALAMAIVLQAMAGTYVLAFVARKTFVIWRQ